MKKEERILTLSPESEAKLYIVGWILWFCAMFFMIAYALWLRK
jgi:hypothetical protein